MLKRNTFECLTTVAMMVIPIHVSMSISVKCEAGPVALSPTATFGVISATCECDLY